MLSVIISLAISAVAIASQVITDKSLSSPGILPKVASVSVIGNVTDPSVSRDSCASTRIGTRAFWTCRDTMAFDASNDRSVLPLVTNSASWTDFTASGALDLSQHSGVKGAGSTGSNTILEMYGVSPTSYPAYFPVPSDACPVSGVCTDNTRWAIWPNSAPLVTANTDQDVIAYTWIPKAHLDHLKVLNTNPPTSLYRSSFKLNSGSPDTALPEVELVAENFWDQNVIAYGSYGGLVVDGTAYLYGQSVTSPPGVTLAKVPVDFIEDVSQYSYYVAEEWTKTQPSITNKLANIPNAGTGGQGTFYYSGYFNSYVWIGGEAIGGAADFYLATAPAPEGPWTQPSKIYSGANGDSSFVGGYSCVANPALLTSTNEKGIYLTWTQAFDASTYGAYVTPLVYLEWE